MVDQLSGGDAHGLHPASVGDAGAAPRGLRKSTEHQKYSIENQAEAIRVYAESRGIQVVRSYADRKSGLLFDRRHGLRQLIEDVLTGRADYKAILVYDVTRCRFQDPDESAYYEYICKRAKITVHYCAEQFENDGTSFAAIVKSIKRAMAGEFSRDQRYRFSGPTIGRHPRGHSPGLQLHSLRQNTVRTLSNNPKSR